MRTFIALCLLIATCMAKIETHYHFHGLSREEHENAPLLSSKLAGDKHQWGWLKRKWKAFRIKSCKALCRGKRWYKARRAKPRWTKAQGDKFQRDC